MPCKEQPTPQRVGDKLDDEQASATDRALLGSGTRQTNYAAMAMAKKSADQTGPKTQPGGAHTGRTKSA